MTQLSLVLLITPRLLQESTAAALMENGWEIRQASTEQEVTLNLADIATRHGAAHVVGIVAGLYEGVPDELLAMFDDWLKLFPHAVLFLLHSGHITTYSKDGKSTLPADLTSLRAHMCLLCPPVPAE